MPTFVDAQTPTRVYLNPALVMLAGRRLGPTHGGLTLTITPDEVEITADGKNQALVGMRYTRSVTLTAEFQLKELSTENLNIVHRGASTGSAGSRVWTMPANMTLYQAGQYAGTLQIFYQNAATGAYLCTECDNGIASGSIVPGESGEMTLQVTYNSVAPIATPDALPWRTREVAALPNEVGGP